MDNVDKKLEEGKLQLLRDRLGSAAGGPDGLYRRYRAGVLEAQRTWSGPYQQASNVPADVEQRVDEEHAKAWGQYVEGLRKRGWSPASVPAIARDRVRKDVVGRGVAVPRDWQPWDEPGFRAAIGRRVHQQVGAARAKLKGVPPGLAWPTYFAHATVQTEMRTRSGLPDAVRLKHDYASPEEFTREVFTPAINHAAAKELKSLDAPTKDFEVGGPLQQRGMEGARALLVPPMALFFSLLGAIGHLAKLGYLLVAMVAAAAGMRIAALWLVPFAVVAGAWTALSQMDNPVTRTPIYQYMSRQIAQAGGDAAHTTQRLQARALANALHVISVGQGYGYPLNEAIRRDVLGGFTFGYSPRTRSESVPPPGREKAGGGPRSSSSR